MQVIKGKQASSPGQANEMEDEEKDVGRRLVIRWQTKAGLQQTGDNNGDEVQSWVPRYA